MKIVILGLTITSSWGNGHATTYRALVKALAARGHFIHFIEKDVEWYRNNRDLPDPDYCRVMIYESWKKSRVAIRKEAASADIIVIGSYFPDGIAAAEELAQGAVPMIFYDIDTPVTLAALRRDGRTEYLDPAMIPAYAAYLSFTGGSVPRELERKFGSPHAVPLYCSVDAALYVRSTPRVEFRSDLGYLGTYAADRQPKLMELLDQPARSLPERNFLVAGPMYPPETTWASNVRHLTHVYPRDHPALYSSSRFTLNITRADMVAAGYSPSVRLFEASACGAAIISDCWPGIEEFFTPGEEILLASSRDEVIDYMENVSEQQARRIGEAARQRILEKHTATHRALEFEQIVDRILTETKQSRKGLAVV